MSIAVPKLLREQLRPGRQPDQVHRWPGQRHDLHLHPVEPQAVGHRADHRHLLHRGGFRVHYGYNVLDQVNQVQYGSGDVRIYGMTLCTA